MTEESYVPTTDEVRAVWREWNGYGGLINRTGPEPTTRAGMVAEFDRWLAQVKADALREAAVIDDPDHYTEVALGGGDYVRDWLNARADRIESGR